MSGKASTGLMAAARQAINSGDKETARRLLLAASRHQPDDFRVWLWLAGIAAEPEQALGYVLKAEALQPGNPTIAKAKKWAEGQMPLAGLAINAPSSHPLQVSAPLSSMPNPAMKTPPASRTPRALGLPTKPAPKHNFARLALAGLAVLATMAIMVTIAVLYLNGWFGGQEQAIASGHQEIATVTPTTTDSSPAAAATSGTPDSTPGDEKQPTATNTLAPIPSASPGLLPKNVVAGAAEPRPTWTLTPVPTNTPSPTPTFAPTFVAADVPGSEVWWPVGLAPGERWIDVSLSAQTLTAYEGSLPVFETLVSTGKYQYPTVTGQFRIWLRFEAQDMDGYRLGYDYYLKNVPYVQYFYQDYALHGTYWHTNFGHPMSHGCVNLSPADSAWLYAFADYGTLVNIHP